MLHVALLAWTLLAARTDTARVTLIHLGDLHGHLVPRPSVVGPGAGGTEGGVARIATIVRRIREREAGHSLTLVTGDLVQGSAEALFTRGAAVLDAVRPLGVDASVPGNWDFVYGAERFHELFVDSGEGSMAGWPALAANLYDEAGAPILRPYLVREVGGVRVALVGITTRRGPRAVGDEVTRGLRFTDGERELRAIVPMLRGRERADVVVVLSEQELANNVRLAATIPGIDAVLSADMHERTMRPIVAPTGTVLVEEGSDGAMVGELTLLVVRGRVVGTRWTAHVVGDEIPDDPAVAARVAEVRAPFVRGARFDGLAREAIGAHRIGRPIDEVVGYTDVALHRAGHTDDSLPASVEGTAHDLIADAMRETTGADVAILRGFRFGTELPPGPITREALYHWLPLGAAVARVDRVTGATIERLVQRSVDGAFDPDARRWTGGWLAAFSGLTFDLDLDRPAGSRATNLRVRGRPLDRSGRTTYSLAGLWFADEPGTVNACAPCAGGRVGLVRGDAGVPLDAVDVVARWLASLPGRTARVRAGRVRLARPLPRPAYGFPVMQPLGGARARPDS